MPRNATFCAHLKLQNDFFRVAGQKLMRYQGVTICEDIPCAVGGPAGNTDGKMRQKLKLATQVGLVTSAMALVASCSTAPVYSVVPKTKPSQEEIAMLTQLQA